ncbi:MAG TPA: PQQ-binding-like beta-propeller repeat protein [Anaeromyxobacteraceae bacterium]|nr:PQQ-binding-like beta-propeller repeat protein [Anaeromyxobacteraceae bacterium]
MQIRIGSSWRHDLATRDALRRAAGRAAERAALSLVDAVAFEVDGVDIGAGRTEGALLPSLESLLRGVAALVAGEPQASVSFREGAVELVLRRRGSSALLTVVSLERPARLLARDVEVELDALAAAALRAASDLFQELALALPSSARSIPARRLRRAALHLRATPPRGPRRPRPAPPPIASGLPVPGRIACAFVLEDEEDLLGAYRGGGRADLASLLAPGRVELVAAGGETIASIEGTPFLLLRDLVADAEDLARAARGGEARFTAELAPPSRVRLEIDLLRGSIAVGRGPPVPCPPLELSRALLEAAATFAREVVARNPRQAGNPYLAELARTAADRLAHQAELEEDLQGPILPARAPAPREPSRRPLGPGKLRRISFRRTAEEDVGFPAGRGLWRAGRLVLVTGRSACAALHPPTGEVRWRSGGCEAAALAPEALLVLRAGVLECVAPRTGRVRWSRPSPVAALADAVAFARGPLVALDGGAAVALDQASGRTLWRFEPPAASRIHAAAFGGVLLVGADNGILYGLDVAGGLAFRLRAPGPALAGARGAGRHALLLAGSDTGASLLAVDPARGARLWEAPLDLAPSGTWAVARGRAVVPGTLGGDPMVTLVDPGGRTAWTVAPPLSGPVAVGAGGDLVLLQDGAGAVQAVGLDGSTRWSFAREPGQPPPGPLAPSLVRGTVLSGADGLAALDAATGAPLGLAQGVAPVRMEVDADLSAVLLEADGAVVVLRLATHLSVL